MAHPKAKAMQRLSATIRKQATAATPGRPAVAAAALVPLTIKLKPEVVTTIIREVARRKGQRLPGRTIQPVVEDGVLATFGEPAAGTRRKAG